MLSEEKTNQLPENVNSYKRKIFQCESTSEDKESKDLNQEHFTQKFNMTITKGTILLSE